MDEEQAVFEQFRIIKGALSSLWQLLAAEIHFKMMKNAFYFTLKALLALQKFKYLSWIFSPVKKQLD